MREITHAGAAGLPPRLMDAADLPWRRRDRADREIRKAIGELRALAVEDGLWAPQYRAMADCYETSLRLLDLIENWGYSVKVPE